MVWPASDVNNTNTSSGSTIGQPAAFRSDARDLVIKFNQIRNHVTAFIQGLLDDTDAATARATLGASPIPRNFMSGLVVSQAFTTLTVAAGQCADSGNTIMMELSSAITKGTGSWVVGSGNGGLDTGTIANNTWYFVHLIRRPDTGVVDALLSLSATAPTMPTNYTQRRLVGVWRMAAGIFEDWYQVGRQLRYKAPVQNFNAVAASTGARTARTLTVPTTVNVMADIGVGLANGNSGGLYISDLNTNDVMTGIGSGLHQGGTHAAASFGGRCWVRTNTSGQVGERVSSGPATFSLYTFGFDMSEMLGL